MIQQAKPEAAEPKTAEPAVMTEWLKKIYDLIKSQDNSATFAQ